MILAPDKEHKKVFPEVPVVGLRNGKSYRDYLVRAALAKSSDPLNCNSEKVLYLLKCKVCGEAPYVGEAKTKFRYRFNNYKSKHRALRKGNRKIPQKRFHDHYCLDGHLGIDDWDFTLFKQCETYEQPKERETF